MKIWLDDIREAPVGWLWVKTVGEVKWHLLGDFDVTEISLDHDLGENQPTGYDLIKWFEEKVITKGFSFPKIRIHTANPVGRANIEAAVKRIEKCRGERLEVLRKYKFGIEKLADYLAQNYPKKND